MEADPRNTREKVYVHNGSEGLPASTPLSEAERIDACLREELKASNRQQRMWSPRGRRQGADGVKRHLSTSSCSAPPPSGAGVVEEEEALRKAICDAILNDLITNNDNRNSLMNANSIAQPKYNLMKEI